MRMIRLPSLFFFLLIFHFFGCIPQDTNQDVLFSYEMNITITAEQTHAGLSTRNDKIYFGTVPQGATSVRQIRLTNHAAKQVRVVFDAQGDIGRYIYIPDSGTILNPLEERVFIVEARVPQNASLGSYVGLLKVLLENP